MKKLEFETSKGGFCLVEAHEYGDKWVNSGKHTYVCMLKRITEEKASEIVDDELYDYVLFRGHLQNYCETAIESLHSLLKSKGIHLYKNPYTNSTDLNSSFFSMQTDFNKEKQAEQKTFYNPYIFKIK